MPLRLPRFCFAAFLLIAPLLSRAHLDTSPMRSAALAFLSSLTPEQQKKTVFPFDHRERENWHFVPRSRAGLPLKEMSPAQKDLALSLLRSGLSARGAAKAEAIIALENVLRELEGGALRRDPGLYYITIFGQPDPDAPWGWRFEGHHLSFNFTLPDADHLHFAPSFMGSNPAEVPHGPKKGLRILQDEDDLARTLVKSFDAAQRAIAVFSNRAPYDIITGNDREVSPLSPAGLPAAQMTPDQRAQLIALVKIYVDRWRPDVVAETFAEIKQAGLDQITFAWAGGFERGEANYYRIQGPTFLIEFDNTQNNANHIHTTFRDFKNDFGRDALREHYERDHHHP